MGNSQGSARDAWSTVLSVKPHPSTGYQPLDASREIAALLPARSRSTNFWILPVAVFGSSAKMTCRGHLNLARRAWQNPMSSAELGSAAPALSSMKAHGTSPHFSSGWATTAACRTLGWQ